MNLAGAADHDLTRSPTRAGATHYARKAMDRRRQPPRYNAVVASAAVMTRRPDSMAKLVQTETWQDDAWNYYDEVGELRFAIGWVANGLSRVNLAAARRPDQLGDEPTPLRTAPDDDTELTALEADTIDLVGKIADGPDGQSQLLHRLGVNLSVPGIGWVLVENETDDDETDGLERRRGDLLLIDRARPIADPPAAPDPTWRWRVCSSDEIRESGDLLEVRSEDTGAWRPIADEHVLVKVWRSHPRRADIADSPCRPNRRVLRRIQLLDDHIDATAQSRLAGAGLLVLPSEVEFKPMIVRDPDDATIDGEPVEDDFSDVLVDTMTIPIGDRGSAAAVVPLTVKIPGEYVDKVRHITFWSEFSDVVDDLQDRAIKRLALGMDMPPEIVTGVSGMNHWGAWQVEEQAVSLHIEPLAEIITHALTIGYLRPALVAAGHSVDDARTMMVIGETSDLTNRPDRSDDAVAAYDRIELAGAALRRETGLSESDAPSEQERRMRLLLRTLDRAPTLAGELLPLLGVDADIDTSNIYGNAPATPTETTPDRPNLGPPDDDRNADPAPDETTEPTDAIAASFVEACDGLVHRSLERAGGRLRRAAGRGVTGGAGAVDCDDPTRLHVHLDAQTFATLDELMTDVWSTRTGAVAARFGVDPDNLETTLDGYVRALIADGRPYERTEMDALLRSDVLASVR